MRFDYMLCCVGSSIDKDSGALSLFSIVDEIGLTADALGKVAPIETHFRFTAPEEVGREVEIRTVWRDSQGEERPSTAPPLAFSVLYTRMRIRAPQMMVPAAFGEYRRHVEWRLKGADIWNRDPISWPFTIHDVAAGVPILGPARAVGGG